MCSRIPTVLGGTLPNKSQICCGNGILGHHLIMDALVAFTGASMMKDHDDKQNNTAQSRRNQRVLRHSWVKNKLSPRHSWVSAIEGALRCCKARGDWMQQISSPDLSGFEHDRFNLAHQYCAAQTLRKSKEKLKHTQSFFANQNYAFMKRIVKVSLAILS